MERCVTEFSPLAPRSRRTPGQWPLAVVFDCDGLLLDTAACWHAAYESVALELEASVRDIDLEALNGASVALAAQRLGAMLGAEVAPSLLRCELEDLVLSMPMVALPGAHELLEMLVSEMPLAVATNAPIEFVTAALRRAGLLDFFSIIVSAEQTSAPKPHPAVYLEACRRLEVDPSDAVAFEDSVLGAAAARAASLLVVAVPSTREAQMDADLTVGRLDDPRVLGLLGLGDASRRRRIVHRDGTLRLRVQGA